jgi:tetratricopeptide (TPR) repeat protein
MSLLLEALKKAELAKQIAKANAEASGSAPAPADPAEPPTAREKPPEVTQPLEILTDDLPYPEQERAAAAAARPELSLQQLAAPEPEALQYAAEAPGNAERARAQQLFEVKEMDYNPRRPFYMTLAVLGLVGLGYAGYVWWQTRPKQYAAVTPIAAVAPGPASPSVVAAAPPLAPTVPPPSEAPAAPSTAPATPPPMPEGAKVQDIPPIQPVRPPRARQTQRAAAAPRRLRSETSPEATAGQRAGEALAPISINAPVVSVDPQIERAYQALQRNDLAAAREDYQRVLSREPTNRDALLGLAAISLRTGDLDSAESRYLRLLEIDPRDTQAVSSLIALHGQLDPVASESRLKTLIASQPEAAPLHFALGNQYAKQSRWPEAQAAYFRAYSVNPENADYAFNLAVSLDQLRQSKPALQYYQRALLLTELRAASFSRAQARARVQELSK